MSKFLRSRSTNMYWEKIISNSHQCSTILIAVALHVSTESQLSGLKKIIIKINTKFGQAIKILMNGINLKWMLPHSSTLNARTENDDSLPFMTKYFASNIGIISYLKYEKKNTYNSHPAGGSSGCIGENCREESQESEPLEPQRVVRLLVGVDVQL